MFAQIIGSPYRFFLAAAVLAAILCLFPAKVEETAPLARQETAAPPVNEQPVGADLSERTGSSYAEAEEAFVSRAALGRMVTEDEVGEAVRAMLRMRGLCGADIDLSAGMVAR